MNKNDVVPFVVSVRLSADGIDICDIAAQIEGVSRGVFLRNVLGDWLSGVHGMGTDPYRCWKDLQKARTREKVLNRQAFIEKWINDHA
jgi:hypothetical protein